MPFRPTKPPTQSSIGRLKRVVISQEGPFGSCPFTKTALETLEERSDPGAAVTILDGLKVLRELNEGVRGVPWASAAEERDRRR